MIYGYARVSTSGQDLTQQIVQLEQAGCLKIFREQATGANSERNQLARARLYMRSSMVMRWVLLLPTG
jgi:hypothetical protein